MLDNETIDTLTREAKPRDFRMLRSYVARAATVQYVCAVMIPVFASGTGSKTPN